MLPQNTQELIKQLDQGKKAKHVFFWWYPGKNRQVGKSCFSQWYKAPFLVDGLRYVTAEHY